jgi:hypothetical protein
MSPKLKSLSLLLVLGLLSACSSQNRNAELDLSSNDILDAVQLMGQSVGGSSLFNELYSNDDPESPTYIYYAEGPSSLGPAWATVSIFDGEWDFISSQITSVFDVTQARVVLLDGFDSQNERRFALAIELYSIWSDRPESKVFYSDPGMYEFTEDELIIEMSMSGGEVLVVRTFDISEEYEAELGGVIQLSLGIGSSSADDLFIGKIPTLVGFE